MITPYNQHVQSRYHQLNTELNKTLHKLSSGYRINQAADDAAGLGISEKMRAQIRGLYQAAENIENGMNLIKTAEAGLASIQNPHLARMRELTLQAANGTMTASERQAIQTEIDDLKKSIDSIAKDTEFNTIQVLSPDRLVGSIPSPTDAIDIVFFIDDSSSMTEEIETVRQSVQAFAEKMDEYGNVKIGTVSVINDKEDRDLDLTDDVEAVVNHIQNKHKAKTALTNNYGHIFQAAKGEHPSINFRENSKKVFILLTDTDQETSGHISEQDLKKVLEDHNIQSYVFGLDLQFNGSNQFPYASSYDGFADEVIIPSSASEVAQSITPNLTGKIVNNDKFQLEEIQPSDLILQIGANEGQQLAIPLYNNTSNSLAIQSIEVDPYEKAIAALEAIDTASEIISERRSTYGALQNRLEFAFNVVSIASENTTKSESTLRGADIPREVMKLKKEQTLLQSTQSMMAQINQMSQEIIAILK